jgi:hypothetical protein
VSKLRGEGKRIGKRPFSGELFVSEEGGKLQKNERNSACCYDELVSHLGSECLAESLLEEAASCLVVQGAEVEVVQPGTVKEAELPLAGSEEHCDALRLEPPGGEDERVGRRLIEPVGVVHQAENGTLLRKLGEHAENRDRDEEAIRP